MPSFFSYKVFSACVSVQRNTAHNRRGVIFSTLLQIARITAVRSPVLLNACHASSASGGYRFQSNPFSIAPPRCVPPARLCASQPRFSVSCGRSYCPESAPLTGPSARSQVPFITRNSNTCFIHPFRTCVNGKCELLRTFVVFPSAKWYNPGIKKQPRRVPWLWCWCSSGVPG